MSMAIALTTRRPASRRLYRPKPIFRDQRVRKGGEKERTEKNQNPKVKADKRQKARLVGQSKQTHVTQRVIHDGRLFYLNIESIVFVWLNTKPEDTLVVPGSRILHAVTNN